MIKRFGGKTPRIAESAFVSQAAYVIGNVKIGENSGIWPGAVVRGDFASIKIGSNSDIEDNSVLHTSYPMEIGDNVIIGHGVVMHGKKIGNNTIIGINATILDEAEIGDYCIVAAGCVVTEKMKIPSRSFVAGVPAKVKREVTEQQMARLDVHNRYYTKEYRKSCKEQGL